MRIFFSPSSSLSSFSLTSNRIKFDMNLIPPPLPAFLFREVSKNFMLMQKLKKNMNGFLYACTVITFFIPLTDEAQLIHGVLQIPFMLKK